MSQVKLNMIWQHNTVLPYILGQLRQNIEAITPVEHIYLTGSRAYTPMQEWGVLEGKDWDIVVVCAFAIVNTKIWTSDVNYHIDLTMTTSQKVTAILQNAIELYPNNELQIIPIVIIK
jgi:hypothetical protein